MKVWTVWSGSYSDRGMLGVFSTFEKAEQYRSRRAIVDEYMDDEPIEYELDSEKDPSIAVVYFMADGTCEYISEYPVTCEVIDYESIPDRVHYSFEQPRWHVQVSFQPDKERMIQAARDKLAAWRAREAGL